MMTRSCLVAGSWDQKYVLLQIKNTCKFLEKKQEAEVCHCTELCEHNVFLCFKHKIKVAISARNSALQHKQVIMQCFFVENTGVWL